MYQHYQTPPHERRQRYHICGQPVEWGDHFIGYVLQPQFWIDDKPVTICPQCGTRLTTTHLYLSPYAYEITHARTQTEADAIVTRLEAQGIPAAAVSDWLWGWTVNTDAGHVAQARAIVQGGRNADQ